MSNFQLIKSTQFNGIEFDCYVESENQDISSDFWATREQIGKLLEYEYPRESIGKIHERNKARLDKFSGEVNLTTPSGVQNTRVYNFKGLLEICRFSSQPKADAVMDFLWDIADEIRRTGSYISQAQSPEVRRLQNFVNEQHNIEERIKFWSKMIASIETCKESLSDGINILVKSIKISDDRRDMLLLEDTLNLAHKLVEHKLSSLEKRQNLISELIRL